MSDATANVPKTGTWTITLTRSSGSTTYDGWLYDCDLGGSKATLPTGNTSKTVAMPATANGAITVGAYVTKDWWPSYNGISRSYGETLFDIASFSSIGPTADNRQKPDIAAPGSVITAALSSGVDTTGEANYIVKGNKHWIMQGTSMSCPHVTGGTALLLGANPSLTAAQIKSLYTSTANSDSYASGLPNYTWGYGKFDVLEAIAQSIWSSASVVRTTLAYDGTGSDSYIYLTGTYKCAVRFTPSSSGKLTGTQISTPYQEWTPLLAGNGPLVCEVYTDNAGAPGTKIGTTVTQPFAMLTPSTNNYIQLSNTNVDVVSGTNYHLVLSNTNSADTLSISLEDVTTGNRSSYYNGSSWYPQTFNLKIRPIITTTSGLTGVDDVTSQQPQVFTLHQNYPNPFNPSTKIAYTIPTASNVTLKIFNLLGQEVATLVNEKQEANTYVKEFDASRLSSGIYFYQINAGSFNATKKMILMK